MQSYTTLTELVESNPKYSELRTRLQFFTPGSDEYFKQLYLELPLTSWPHYKTFVQSQAFPLPEPQNNGYGHIYRSSLLKTVDGTTTTTTAAAHFPLVSSVDPQLPSLYHHFQLSCRLWPHNDCLGCRQFLPSDGGGWSPGYHYETYSQINLKSRRIGSGILSLVNPSSPAKNDFIVCILSYNKPEWIITDLACQAYSLPTTALYETLGPQTSEYIMNITESPILFFAKRDFNKILNFLPKLKFLRILVSFDELSNEELALINSSILSRFENQNIKLYTISNLEQIGKLNEISPMPPKGDSIYTISFTSGTTGMPKGVEMTHENITAGLAFSWSTFKMPSHKKGKQFHDICFLPLAHIFQRMIVAHDLSTGVGIGFLHEPDPNVLVEDLKILNPDTVSMVPRILTKFEAGIKTSLEKSALQKNVATNILDHKQARFTSKSGPDRSLMNSLLYHRILIDKIREGLGLTNTSFIITGSAPISKETLLFLRSALDIGIRQGYGLTETFAGICLSEPHEKDAGTCGAIGISSECRLKSVPEMGYHAEKHLKGELQLRGPQIFRKYFKNETETLKAIDKDGWFSTGDVAYIDNKGRITVIDRVKNFFKLAQGEYIAPEKIENVYLSTCPYLTQIFVYGDPLKTFLVGILGIDVELVKQLLAKRKKHLKHLSDVELVQQLNKDAQLRSTLLTAFNKCVSDLQGFEKLHNIYVDIEPLKVDDDVLTPTLKIKRTQATPVFKPIFDRLYQEGSIIKNGKL